MYWKVSFLLDYYENSSTLEFCYYIVSHYFCAKMGRYTFDRWVNFVFMAHRITLPQASKIFKAWLNTVLGNLVLLNLLAGLGWLEWVISRGPFQNKLFCEMDRNCTAAIDSDLSHHAFPTEKILKNQTDLVVRKE